MSVGLPGIPSVVLAEITSYFSDWDDIVRLVLCGSSLLTNKIKSGGVKRVHLDEKHARTGALKLVKTLRLDTLSIVGSWQCPPTSEAFNNSIQHLSISTHLQDDLVESDTLNLKLSPTGVYSSAYLPWNVSATFPSLKSLNIVHLYENWKDEFEAHFWNSFLSMLPPSLTSLSLPRLLVSDWTSLPPHLTSLKGLVGIFPLSDSLMSSLVELDLHLDSLPYNPVALGEASFDEPDIPYHRNIANLTFPPHLTSLTLHWNEFTFVLPSLPPNLTRLAWCGRYPTSWPISVQTLLAATPPTVTDLVINGEVTFDASFSILIPILFNLKTLTLLIKTSADKSLIFDKCLRLMPNLEVLDASETRGCRLSLEQLSLLNPSFLTTLKTSFDSACFNPIDDVYPLTKFTKLTDLDAGTAAEHRLFDFACLPSSITTLDIGFHHCTTEMLLSVPSNIKNLKNLKATLDTSLDPTVFESLFLDPSSPYTQELPDSVLCDETLPEIQAAVFCCSSKARFSQTEVLGPNGLERLPRLTTNIQRHRDRNGPAVSIRWPSLKMLPPSLTALKIPREVYTSALSPSLLPKLVYLHLDQAVLPDADLGDFVKLRTLKVAGFEIGCISRCPPNLTRLHSTTANLNACFLPLPTTLTAFTFDGQLLPGVEVVDSLPHLEEFGSTGRYSDAVHKFAETPRPTIKTFLVDLDAKTAALIANVIANFPNLETLHVSGQASYRTFFALSAHYSHRLVIKGGTVVRDLEDLLLSPDLHRENLDRELVSLDSCLISLLKWSMPNWSQDSLTSNVFGFNDETWSAFTKLIAPHLTSLKLATVANLSPTALLDLPKNITKLQIARWPAGSHLKLPSTLKILDVKLLGALSEITTSLPHGLTTLHITAQEATFNKSAALALPQGLVHMKLWGDITDEALSALPCSLVFLHLFRHTLTHSNLKALSSGVRFLQLLPSRAPAKVLLSEDYTGFVTWVAKRPVVDRARRILLKEPDVVEDGAESFESRIRDP